VLTWHSAKALPSARYIALGKEPFADKSYAGGSLPSVTLGKLFAECKLGFAECLGHSAKNPCPVVDNEHMERLLATAGRGAMPSGVRLLLFLMHERYIHP